ncbi:ComEC family competence protein [Acholeplasma hippikon]|uniref:ComEC family competence protein n=2 Tax=Acholeplasma hippikon TaxID=264636 RepID=A0A449BJE6_9MOLU|nr:ComEC family competence protein [Acholeplasma hippikon]
MISHIENSPYGYTYELTNGYETFLLYDDSSYELFSLVKVKGTLKPFDENTIPNGFNEINYYLTKGIKYKIVNPNIELKMHGLKLDLNHILIRLIMDEPILELNELSHLFGLNSITLMLIILLIKKILYYFDIDERKKLVWIIVILTSFYSVGKSFIVLYVLIENIILYVDDKNHLKLSYLDKQSLILIILILINPYIIFKDHYNLIFLYTFLFYFVDIDNKIFSYILSILIFIPFQIKFSYELNIFLLLMPLFKNISKYSFISILLLTLLFGSINLLTLYENFLNKMIDYLMNYNFILRVKRMSTEKMILYEGLLFVGTYYLKDKKLYLIFSYFILLFTFLIVRPISNRVYFLDVKQGDGAVIFKNHEVIVVDAYNKVDEFLKLEGIKTIDHLILTHNDLDHTGDYETILKDFKVKNLYLSGYLNYQINFKNTHYLTHETLFEIKNLELTFLGPLRDLKDKNENSIFFKIKVNDLTYLFTGDLGIDAEKLYVDTYQDLLKADVLKVGHHGSITSSSQIFLDKVKPSIAIISVKLNNKFNFPLTEVLDRFNIRGIKVYQTSKDGTILFKKKEIINFPP